MKWIMYILISNRVFNQFVTIFVMEIKGKTRAGKISGPDTHDLWILSSG